jgi:hypothetical protein
MRKLNLGDNPIMFGDIAGCGACAMQKKILKHAFKNGHFLYIHSPFSKPVLKLQALPTWYIPTGNGNGYLHKGVIDGNGKIKLKDLLERKKPVKRSFKFGQDIPEVGSLAKYGRNFPNGQGFEIQNSFNQDITKKWGNPLLSGTLGRELGPGNTDQIYSNNYFPYNGII